MAKRNVELCVAILEDHFGYYVATLGHILLANRLPLPMIVRKANKRLTVKEIKGSLVILEQHSLLEFVMSEQGGVIYHVDSNAVLRLLRVPRAILTVKTHFGEIAEAIFEEILSNGRISCSNCIRRVTKCIESTTLEMVKTNFNRLVSAQILIRCAVPSGECEGFPTFAKTSDPFLMPEIVMDGGGKASEEQREPRRGRKRKADFGVDTDASILWRVNWLRVERLFRDQIVLDTIDQESEFLDAQALQLAHVLLKVGEVRSEIGALQSNAISRQDVCAYAKDQELSLSREQIDEKLQLIARDSAGIVRRMGESGGGLYVINYGLGIELTCKAQIDSIIRERLGDKALRIFRFLSTRTFVEEDQLEKGVMLSAKECRELSCALVDQNFIVLRQVAKTNDFSPARTQYLYTINWSQLLCSLIGLTHLALRNVILRRIHEAKRNEQLVDRHLKMEIIKSNIEQDPNFDEESRKQQIADIEEAYLTGTDRQELESHRRGQQLLWASEIDLEHSLFILEQHQRQRWGTQMDLASQSKSQKRRSTGIKGLGF